MATLDEKIDVARDLRAKGLSYRRIADRLGISSSMAHEYCAGSETKRRYNERRAKRQRRAAETQDCLDALLADLQDEIAFMRSRGERNKAVIHFNYAARLQAIVDKHALPSTEERS